jgi:putative ABC transport system ATP-binding protein
MNLIGCLDTPTDGHYELSGQSVAKMKKDELATVRNRRVGFVFQNFNLLPQISSFENVEMPLLFGGVSRRQRHQRVEELMDIVLADEPTGNLDSSSGGDIMELFAELWEQGRTMVVITHDAALARRANRQVEIHDGLITRDTRS